MNGKKRYSIAVLIGGVHTFFPQRIIAGIQDAARELDVNVCFFLGTQTKVFFQNMLGEDVGNVYDYQFNTIYDYSLLGGFDGIIINYGTLGVYLEDNNLDRFVRKYHSIPAIVLTETTSLPNCHYLISDNYQGIWAIMEHLIEKHGYRKILHVSGPEGNTDAAERKQAYLDAMNHYGLSPDDSMIALGDYSEFVDQQVIQLLDLHPDAEAIVFANDEMAMAGYRVCAQRGLKVGKDIAITGYDDCKMSRNMVPPLTTISQDGFSLGRQAILDLLKRFHGETVPSRRFPVQFIPRESCGCSAREEVEADTISSLRLERDALHTELSRMQQHSLDFQRKSWFVSYFARDLNNYVNDEPQFFRQIMEDLHRIHRGNMFLFLLKSPLYYSAGDSWTLPEVLHLACYQQNDTIVSYYPYDRPVITRDQNIMQYINDETARQYTFFLLFSSEKQYGLLACDIEQSDFPFFYLISLQLGLSLRYLEITKIEAAHVLEMSRSMELMREQNRVLDLISGYDELTGLLNLRGFTEKVKALQANTASRSAYMIYADLDHLKEINDNWGHPEGNYAIRSAGQILKKCLRDSDILARVGGDEFIALVLSDADSFEHIFRKRVQLACQELNESSRKPFYVEISVGLVHFTFHSNTDIQTILSKADHSLYSFKKFRRASIRKETI